MCAIAESVETISFFPPRSTADISEITTPEERAILDDINRKVGDARTLDEVMTYVFNATQPLSPCSRLAIAFLEDDGQHVVSHWTKTTYENPRLSAGYAEDISNGTLATVIREGRPRIISDLVEYVACRPKSHSTKLLIEEGLRCSMTCPLTVEGRNVGLFFRDSDHPDAYTERDVRLHEAIAHRLSQAVEKAYWIERLSAANRAYQEMLDLVGHELRGPIATIISNAQLLTEGFLGTLEPAQHEEIQRITSKAEYLLEIVGRYLNLAQLDGGELRLNARPDVNFVESVLLPVVDLLNPRIAVKNMQLLGIQDCHKELREPVECDPELMKVVIINLLSNAVKFGVVGGQIRLEAHHDDHAFSLSVWNEGTGFAEYERPKLFRKFSRLRAAEITGERGCGIGLYSAWKIIRLHGGSITADSKPEQWAVFTLEIPQPLSASRPYDTPPSAAEITATAIF